MPTIEDGESCHAAKAHDCCAAKKAKKQIVLNLDCRGVPSFVPGPRDMMKDCPLAVNATAATSKKHHRLPDPARGPVAALPSFEKQPTRAANDFRCLVAFRNRQHTHLRCCVFLI